MDRDSLLSFIDFSRMRLFGTLDALEKSGQDMKKVLSYRPGAGRAHIGWQFMHCAATHDRYLNVGVKGGKVDDERLVTHFAGGSTPSDQLVPDVATIRAALDKTYKSFRAFLEQASPEDLAKVYPNKRTLAESYQLLAWHEAHHQGQIHLTWNMFKQANEIK